MDFLQVTENKKRYLPLLLLADEQESMIDRYLEQGDLFALYDGGLRTICVVCDKGAGEAEIKNLATAPPFRGWATAAPWWTMSVISIVPVVTVCWWEQATVPSPSPFTRNAALPRLSGSRIFSPTITIIPSGRAANC